jgi:septum formation protein
MTFQRISRQYPLILASASPRRKRLLAQVGLPFRSVVSEMPEEAIRGVPEEASRVLAQKKALHGCAKSAGSWVLGADTIVAVGQRMLGKPEGEEDADTMLSLLSGKEHRVITGFCVVSPSGVVAHLEAVVTRVRFKTLSEQEIKGYIDTGEPFGKAGSYAIQGIGAFMVEAISGSYTNVVGLPLSEVVRALVSTGALETFPLSPG